MLLHASNRSVTKRPLLCSKHQLFIAYRLEFKVRVNVRTIGAAQRHEARTAAGSVFELNPMLQIDCSHHTRPPISINIWGGEPSGRGRTSTHSGHTSRTHLEDSPRTHLEDTPSGCTSRTHLQNTPSINQDTPPEHTPPWKDVASDRGNACGRECTWPVAEAETHGPDVRLVHVEHEPYSI